jgi:nucleoside-diphosphate-sugar epimerase
MNIIIGANGYLGSYLHYKIEKSIGVVTLNPSNSQISYTDFLQKYNNNEYKMYNIIICCSASSIKSVINNLKKNSNKFNKFILISSAVVYDGIVTKNNVYKEKHTKYFCSNDSYAKTTYDNEKLFSELNGSNIILRCGTMFGFSPNLNATRGINRMIYSSLFDNKIELNRINLKKSFISLNDIYSAIFFLTSNKPKLSEISVPEISKIPEIVHELSEIILDESEESHESEESEESEEPQESEEPKQKEINNIDLYAIYGNDQESDKCLDNSNLLEIYNLSSFIMSLHNLGRMFKNRFNVKIEYKHFNKKEYEFYLNIDKLKDIGWKPSSHFRTIVEDITCDFDSLKKLSYNMHRIEQVPNKFNLLNCFTVIF